MNVDTMANITPIKHGVNTLDVLWGAWVKNIRYSEERRTWDFMGIYDTIWKQNKGDFPFTTELKFIISYQASIAEAKGKFKLSLELLDLDKPIFSITQDLVLPEFLDADIRWYQDYKLENVIIKEPRQYWLYILVDGQEKHNIPLYVSVPKETIIMDMENDVKVELWPEDHDRVIDKLS